MTDDNNEMTDEQRRLNRKAKMKRIAHAFDHVFDPDDAPRQLWKFGMADSLDEDAPLWPDYALDDVAYTLLVEQLPSRVFDEETGVALRMSVESVRKGNDEYVFVAGYGKPSLKFAAQGGSLRAAFINLADELAKRERRVEVPFWKRGAGR